MTSILKKCASIDTVISYNKKNGNRKNDKNKPWFDQECKKQKNKVKRTGGKLKHDPHNVSLRQNLFFENNYVNLSRAPWYDASSQALVFSAQSIKTVK